MAWGIASGAIQAEANPCASTADCPAEHICGFPLPGDCGAPGGCFALGERALAPGIREEVSADLFPDRQGACGCNGQPVRIVRQAVTGSVVTFTHVDGPATREAGVCPPPPPPEPVQLCAAAPTCSDDPAQRMPVLMTAAELPEVSRFVGIAKRGGYILADLDPAFGGHTSDAPSPSNPGPHQVIVTPPGVLPRTDGPILHLMRQVPGDVGPLVMSAIAGSASRVAVLQCGQTRCAVQHADVNTPIWIFESEIFDLADLQESELTGVAIGPEPQEGDMGGMGGLGDLNAPFCVYGEGLHCFVDGGFTTVYRTDEDQSPFGQIQDVQLSQLERPLLVGEMGLYAVWDGLAFRQREPMRVEGGGVLPALRLPTFSSVSAHNGRTTASLANGALVEAAAGHIDYCDFGIPLRRTFRLSSGDPCPGDRDAPAGTVGTRVTAMGEDGRLLESRVVCGQGEQWSCGPIHEGAIDLGLWSCGVADNPLLLTSDTLYGELQCPLVP